MHSYISTSKPCIAIVREFSTLLIPFRIYFLCHLSYFSHNIKVYPFLYSQFPPPWPLSVILLSVPLSSIPLSSIPLSSMPLSSVPLLYITSEHTTLEHTTPKCFMYHSRAYHSRVYHSRVYHSQAYHFWAFLSQIYLSPASHSRNHTISSVWNILDWAGRIIGMSVVIYEK